ncbi:MAG: hypothetical protein ACRERV_10670 [Methylococcales bacterium]
MKMAVSNLNHTEPHQDINHISNRIRTSKTITGYNVSMGEQDILSKQIFKNLVRDFATYLFGLAVSEVELLESSKERIEDRRADLVARVTTLDGETFILHIEIQNTNQAKIPVRMLRYLTDILLAHPKFDVRQYLGACRT